MGDDMLLGKSKPETGVVKAHWKELWLLEARRLGRLDLWTSEKYDGGAGVR